MTPLSKAFVKHLSFSSYKYGLSKTFNDLLTLGICAYHQVNLQSELQQKDATNEALYLETIKPYTKEELTELSKALGVLQVNVLESPYADLLGDYFTVHITNGQNGQFFTPEPICQFMATITHDSTKEGKQIFDPACGSGRMLLAAAKISPNNFFFGADNDATCAKMTTLNFFLNGLRGEVAWMNSLTNEWYGGWQVNLDGIGILPIQQENSVIHLKTKFQRKKTPPTGKQLTLF